MGDDLELRIARLRIEPGDTLVLKATGSISATTATKIREHVGEIVPDVPVLILDDRLDLSVLTKAEIDARAAPPTPSVSPQEAA